MNSYSEISLHKSFTQNKVICRSVSCKKYLCDNVSQTEKSLSSLDNVFVNIIQSPLSMSAARVFCLVFGEKCSHILSPKCYSKMLCFCIWLFIKICAIVHEHFTSEMAGPAAEICITELHFFWARN